MLALSEAALGIQCVGDIPSPSFHFMSELRGMSENSKNLPSLNHTGPSHHTNPSASFSILASGEISLSKRGSLLSSLPNVGYGDLSLLIADGRSSAMTTPWKRSKSAVVAAA